MQATGIEEFPAPDPAFTEQLVGILDIETTGWLNAGGKIVEVGLVGLHLPTGKRYKLFDSLCQEPNMTEKDRNAWIFSNSDMQLDEVLEAPMLQDILPKIRWACSLVKSVTAFNRKFDVEFMASRGLALTRLWPCLMLTMTPVCRIPKPGFRKYKWPSCEEAWHHLFPDKPYVEAHRGFDDAWHEALIAHELYKQGYIKD